MSEQSIESIRDIFREHLLAALDSAAKEAFGLAGDSGATDADLPRLFAAIDIQVDVLVKRHRDKLKFINAMAPRESGVLS